MKTEAGKSRKNTVKAVTAAVLLLLTAVYAVAVYHYEYGIYFQQDAASITGYYRGVCSNLAAKTDFYSTMESLSERKQMLREKILRPDQQDADRQEEADVLTGLDYALTKAVSYIIWDNATGQMLDSNREQLPERMKSRDTAVVETETITDVDGIAVGRFTLDGTSCLAASGTLTDGNTDVTLCVFTEDWQAQRNALFGAVTAAVFAIMFAGACLFLLSRLRKKYYSEAYVQQKLPFLRPGNYVRQVKGALTVIAVTFLFVSLLLFSVQSILIVSHTVSKANRSLILLEENRSQNQEALYNAAVRVCKDYTNDIATAISDRAQADPDDLDGWLKEMADMTGVDEITLYDENGIIAHSTTPYKGYRLSTDETKPEYRLWEILNGGASELVYCSEEEDCTCIAVRRTDEVGILRLVTSEDILSSLLEKVGFVDLFKAQTYLNAYTLYFRRDAADDLRLVKPGSVEKTITNTLPSPEKGETTIGLRNIDGETCLYIAAGGEELVTAFACPVTDIIKNSAVYLVLTATVYFLMAAAVFLVFSKTVSFSEMTGNHDPTPYVNFCKERNTTLRLILSVLAVTSFAVVLRAVSVLGGTNAQSFFGRWEKGVNLMAIYRIQLSAAVLIGIYSIIDTLNALLCKLLHAKGTTISTLLSQIIKLGCFIVYLVFSMAQLGVDAVAIFSSLGLAGLALSIGSKDTISDMVAGLFIAFEGQLRLGDIVEANGFSGEIASLGIRTTTIKRGYKELILNNTDVKKVTNYSRGACIMKLYIVFPFDTDLDAVKELVAASKERICKASESRLSGTLAFKGVNSFESYGMECQFAGTVSSPAQLNKCARLCRTELIKILNENGISPAVMGNMKRT